MLQFVRRMWTTGEGLTVEKHGITVIPTGWSVYHNKDVGDVPVIIYAVPPEMEDRFEHFVGTVLVSKKQRVVRSNSFFTGSWIHPKRDYQERWKCIAVYTGEE